jgi:mono/diheme cytochrome c family protein
MLGTAAASWSETRTDAAGAKPTLPLVWDNTEKILTPSPGETNGGFQFTVTNVSDQPVTIVQIRPTCGCTIAEMPSDPWVLAPGASGTFIGNIDFRGKEGTVTKALFVNSSAGTQQLLVTVRIPTPDESMRKENQRVAEANRQAVFQGDCAKCHLAPTRGLTGGELFRTACGVCHFSPRRASIVPDLLTARQHRDAAFWRKWITEGKEGTLMPAWSKSHGGPLSDEQIDSLVKFALEMLPTEPPPAEASAAAAAGSGR